MPTSPEEHHHSLSEKEIGSVEFATSCSERVQSDSQRAVAMLHSFEYERTRSAFTEITGYDPQCAIAYWGIAMTHYHGLWHNGDTASGREAIRKAQEIAASNKATSPRERGTLYA